MSLLFRDSNSVDGSTISVGGLETPPPMAAADDVPRYETGDDGSYPPPPLAPPLASPSGVSDGGPGPSIEGSPRSPTDNHRSLPVTLPVQENIEVRRDLTTAFELKGLEKEIDENQEEMEIYKGAQTGSGQGGSNAEYEELGRVLVWSDSTSVESEAEIAETSRRTSEEWSHWLNWRDDFGQNPHIDINEIHELQEKIYLKPKGEHSWFEQAQSSFLGHLELRYGPRLKIVSTKQYSSSHRSVPYRNGKARFRLACLNHKNEYNKAKMDRKVSGIHNDFFFCSEKGEKEVMLTAVGTRSKYTRKNEVPETELERNRATREGREELRITKEFHSGMEMEEEVKYVPIDADLTEMSVTGLLKDYHTKIYEKDSKSLRTGKAGTLLILM
jgi:hypothetical protein